MASQINIAVVGVPDDNNLSSSSDLSPTTPILKSARNSLDPLGFPTHTSDNSSPPPPPSPTLSAHSSRSVRWIISTILRDKSSEEHDGSPSLYLAPPPHWHGHRRKGSIGSVSSICSASTTEQDAGDDSSFRLSPLRSAHSDVTSALPSPT